MNDGAMNKILKARGGHRRDDCEVVSALDTPDEVSIAGYRKLLR